MTAAKNLGTTVVVRLPQHLTEQYNASDPASPIEVGDERPGIVVGLTDHDDGQGDTFQTADVLLFHRSDQTTFVPGVPLDVLRGVDESFDDERESEDDASDPSGSRENDGQANRSMPPAGGTPQDGPANTSARGARARS